MQKGQCPALPSPGGKGVFKGPPPEVQLVVTSGRMRRQRGKAFRRVLCGPSGPGALSTLHPAFPQGASLPQTLWAGPGSQPGNETLQLQ